MNSNKDTVTVINLTSINGFNISLNFKGVLRRDTYPCFVSTQQPTKLNLNLAQYEYYTLARLPPGTDAVIVDSCGKVSRVNSAMLCQTLAHSTLIIYNCPRYPPLSIEQIKDSQKQLVSELENTSPLMLLRFDKVYRSLANTLNRPAHLIRDYVLYSGLPYLNWMDLYTPVKLSPHVPLKIVQKAINDGTFEVHCYWRETDHPSCIKSRNLTAKYVLSFSTGEKRMDVNWIISVVGNNGFRRLQSGSLERKKARSARQLQQLLLNFVNDGSFSSNSTVQTLEYHLSNHRYMEWSSQEILVYIPTRMIIRILGKKSGLPPELLHFIMNLSTDNSNSREFSTPESGGGTGALVMRLHQETRIVNYLHNKDALDLLKKPTPDQKMLLQRFGDVVGIGKPMNWNVVFAKNPEIADGNNTSAAGPS
ncbi:hypothetical protein BDR26DRAFT_858102, partial [Obelidium mucronatum]